MHATPSLPDSTSVQNPVPLVTPRGRLLHRTPRRIRALLCRERARLRAHFRAVLCELAARDVTSLSGAQRAMREELLESLARYARAGRFPRNLDFPGVTVPYFVDAAGTRCAMAHLIESTGAAALVAQVAGAMNNARVHEMAGEPALRAWLDRAGLSADEAARIQPSYCFVDKGTECFCSSVISPTGVIEGTVLAKPSAQQIKVRIDAIHGSASGNFPGQEITVSASAEIGDAVLIQFATPSYGNVHRLQDGKVVLSCQLAIPALTKADAIAAMLATPMSSGGSTSACREYLQKLDARWGESICDSSGGSGGGCSVASSAGGSPLVLGTALAFAAVWSWRLRRQRSRRRAGSSARSRTFPGASS